MEGRSTRVLVAVTIVIVVVVDALYVAIVVNQDPRPPELFTIPFIACYLLLMVVVLAVSLMHRWSAATRTALRGAMAAAASMRTLRGPMFTPSNLLGAASAVIAVAVLIAGFEVTERIIVCPANGSHGGRRIWIRDRALLLRLRERAPQLSFGVVQFRRDRRERQRHTPWLLTPPGGRDLTSSLQPTSWLGCWVVL